MEAVQPDQPKTQRVVDQLPPPAVDQVSSQPETTSTFPQESSAPTDLEPSAGVDGELSTDTPESAASTSVFAKVAAKAGDISLRAQMKVVDAMSTGLRKVGDKAAQSSRKQKAMGAVAGLLGAGVGISLWKSGVSAPHNLLPASTAADHVTQLHSGLTANALPQTSGGGIGRHATEAMTSPPKTGQSLSADWHTEGYTTTLGDFSAKAPSDGTGLKGTVWHAGMQGLKKGGVDINALPDSVKGQYVDHLLKINHIKDPSKLPSDFQIHMPSDPDSVDYVNKLMGPGKKLPTLPDTQAYNYVHHLDKPLQSTLPGKQVGPSLPKDQSNSVPNQSHPQTPSSTQSTTAHPATSAHTPDPIVPKGSKSDPFAKIRSLHVPEWGLRIHEGIIDEAANFIGSVAIEGLKDAEFLGWSAAAFVPVLAIDRLHRKHQLNKFAKRNALGGDPDSGNTFAFPHEADLDDEDDTYDDLGYEADDGDESTSASAEAIPEPKWSVLRGLGDALRRRPSRPSRVVVEDDEDLSEIIKRYLGDSDDSEVAGELDRDVPRASDPQIPRAQADLEALRGLGRQQLEQQPTVLLTRPSQAQPAGPQAEDNAQTPSGEAAARPYLKATMLGPNGNREFRYQPRS